MNFKNLLSYSLLITISYFLTSCNSTPSISDAQKALSSKIKSASQGLIKVVDFKKTNGQEITFENGTKGYSMEYAATVEFQDDCRVRGQYCVFNGPFRRYTLDHGCLMRLDEPYFEGDILHNKGSKENFNYKMSFEKTENGWRVSELEPQGK